MSKVSVIIPTYNNAEFLSQAIESVIAQTHKDIEIIVVDDGSTDNTRDVMQGYAGRAIYIRQENAGPSKARNAGILRAKGEYIAFLDADDVWFPNKIEEQLKTLQIDSNIALIYSQAVVFNSHTGRELGISPKKIFSGNVFDALLSESGPIVLSSVIVRSRVLDEAGIFDESLINGEDQHLWLRIAKNHAIAGINQALLRRRLHDKNIGFSKDPRTTILDCLDKIIKLFPETNPKIYPPMKKAYLIHSKTLAGTLFYHAQYAKCHALCNKIIRRFFSSPGVIFYWFVTLLPSTSIDCIRGMLKRFKTAQEP